MIIVVSVLSGSLQAETPSSSPALQPPQSTPADNGGTNVKIALITAVTSIIVSLSTGIFALLGTRKASQEIKALKISLDDLLEKKIIRAIERQGGFLTRETLLETFLGLQTEEKFERFRKQGGFLTKETLLETFLGLQLEEEFERFRRALLDPMVNKTREELIAMVKSQQELLRQPQERASEEKKIA